MTLGRLYDEVVLLSHGGAASLFSKDELPAVDGGRVGLLLCGNWKVNSLEVKLALYACAGAFHDMEMYNAPFNAGVAEDERD